MKAGNNINEKDLIALRPAPENSINPFNIDKILGKVLQNDVDADQIVREDDFKSD